MAEEKAGTVSIGKCNVAENMDLAIKYGIAGVPTLLLFKGGEVVARKVGALPKDQLETMIADNS